MTSPAPTPAADRKRLRSFGLLVGGILLAWGGVRYLRHKGLAVPVGATGAVLVLLGLVVPAALRLPYRGWMALGHVLGAINTRVLLFVSFWLLVVPFGLLRRLFSGSALKARSRPVEGGKTYFEVPKADPRGKKHFENMF